MQKPDISAAIAAVTAPIQGVTSLIAPVKEKGNSSDILGPLGGMVGQITNTSHSNDQDVLKDINKFITAVLRFAGFDFGEQSRDLDYKNRDSRLITYFNEVQTKDISPGDLMSFISSGKHNVGLIESFNPETMTGTMYGSDESDENVKSFDFGEQDLNNGASILRPLMQFFMGNVAGIENMEEGLDEDFYEDMNNSYYPSPSP